MSDKTDVPLLTAEEADWAETQEHAEGYVAGWNACRAALLNGDKT